MNDQVGFILEMQEWLNVHKLTNIKPHMVISMDVGKAFDTIQYLLIIKTWRNNE
jgi:hypothetical protein